MEVHVAARNSSFEFRRLLLALTLCATTLLAGCRDNEDIHAYRKFVAGPAAQVKANFLALSPKEQVAVYVVGISRLRPSDTRFARTLAAEGDRVLPALVEELNAQRRGVPPQQLVLVLAIMASEHHLESARQLAPKVKGWCDAWYPPQSYCHEMGAEMGSQTGDVPATAPGPTSGITIPNSSAGMQMARGR
jgi:hypothetical protein